MEQPRAKLMDIYDEIAKEVGTSRRHVNIIVNKFMKAATKKVYDGYYLNFPGLVTFYQTEIKEREGYNPLTQQKVIVPAHVKVGARVPKALRVAVATKEALK